MKFFFGLHSSTSFSQRGQGCGRASQASIKIDTSKIFQLGQRVPQNCELFGRVASLSLRFLNVDKDSAEDIANCLEESSEIIFKDILTFLSKSRPVEVPKKIAIFQCPPKPVEDNKSYIYILLLLQRSTSRL